ncbi:hypothetical protein IM538_21525 [Cytobacillus suaedae]|nr:hypothetical protein IM538_21525 [Cytobacillus suaedae]
MTDEQIALKLVRNEIEKGVIGEPEIKILKVEDNQRGKLVIYYDLEEPLLLVTKASIVLSGDITIDYKNENIRSVYEVELIEKKSD